MLIMDVEPAGVTLWFKLRRRSCMCSVGLDATSMRPLTSMIRNASIRSTHCPSTVR